MRARGCYHRQSPLLERQTQCLACGSPFAREADFWNAFNEGLKAQGMPEVDPYAADKERAMDVQRLQAKKLVVQGRPQLRMDVNERAATVKSRARMYRER